MKIALVTIHNANNYGAIFQAFSLQEILSRYGDVEIINYNNRHISRSFDLVRLKPSLHGFLGMGKDVCRLFPRHRAISKFIAFMNVKMKVTKAYTKEELLHGKAGLYDYYVAGSDQIWNPACVNDKNELDSIYFLDFAPEGTVKFSYASSLGAYNFSNQEKLQIKNYLKSFKAVSVREKGAQVMLQDLLESPVSHVLDPTLLLDKEEWLKSVGIEQRSNNCGKYILLYTIKKTPLVKSAVEYFSKKTGLKVIAIDQGLTAGTKVEKQIRDAGPLDFIKYFSSASFIITDSFHGTTFSLNFGVPFVSLSPGNNVNRIESLLTVVGLKNRILSCESELENIDLNMDFVDAHHKLKYARKSSIEFIVKSIGIK